MTRFLTAPIMYALLAIIAGLGIFAGLQTFRLSAEKLSHQTDLTKNANVLRDLAQLTAKAAEDYRALEHDGETATNTARGEVLKELTDEKAKNALLAADVAAGKRRMREFWSSQSCPTAAVPNPDAADGAGASRAELQGAAVERIAGIGDACSARVRFLIKREQAWQALRTGK